eukprot:267445-Prymnesium_polylepis.2
MSSSSTIRCQKYLVRCCRLIILNIKLNHSFAGGACGGGASSNFGSRLTWCTKRWSSSTKFLDFCASNVPWCSRNSSQPGIVRFNLKYGSLRGLTSSTSASKLGACWRRLSAA